MLLATIRSEDESLFAQIEAMSQIKMYPVCFDPAVKELGYCKQTNILQLHLNNGEKYRYFDVPCELVGQFFGCANIIDSLRDFYWELI